MAGPSIHAWYARTSALSFLSASPTQRLSSAKQPFSASTWRLAAAHCGPDQKPWRASSVSLRSPSLNASVIIGSCRIRKCRSQPLHKVAPPRRITTALRKKLLPMLNSSALAAMLCNAIQYEHVRSQSVALQSPRTDAFFTRGMTAPAANVLSATMAGVNVSVKSADVNFAGRQDQLVAAMPAMRLNGSASGNVTTPKAARHARTGCSFGSMSPNSSAAERTSSKPATAPSCRKTPAYPTRSKSCTACKSLLLALGKKPARPSSGSMYFHEDGAPRRAAPNTECLWQESSNMAMSCDIRHVPAEL
mmetsp:Transcript_18221/g.49987  ORF Transcript_18221/g.49987 Transcript_18221/m.49987 type:complete len:305 (+) Transcript_18221:457-1371(+)